MIQIAVCDDELAVRVLIQEYLSRYAKEKNLELHTDFFENGEALILTFGKQYDLIILDVEMPGMDGIKVAEKIREQDKLVIITFLTLYEKYAYRSYLVEASGYQTKPVEYESFRSELEKYLRLIRNNQEKILVENKGKTYSITKNSIVYISYFNHCLTCHLMDGDTINIKGSLKNFMKNDTEHNFCQIHKSYIVNRIWIEKCVNKEVYLKGIPGSLAVSKHRWKSFYEQYLIFCRDKLK